MSKVAECSRCRSQVDLFMWYSPDPYNDYPLLPVLLCGSCPKPDNIWIDRRVKYDADAHDGILGIKDYTVDFCYSFFGPEDVQGLCFACDTQINMSKGYGRAHLPEHACVPNFYTVAYCKECWREKCANKRREVEEVQLRKLPAYMEKTDEGAFKR